MTTTRGERALLVAVLGLVLVAGPVSAGLAGDGGAGRDAAGATGAPADPIALQSGLDADAITMSVALAENGSAHWTIDYRFELESANETEAFESLQSDIRANRSGYLGAFTDRIRSTVADAENATGREMRAEGFSVTARTGGVSTQYGVVSYEFWWHGFATTPDGEIRAGDALSGLFLDSRTTLQFSWPEGYTDTRISPPAAETGDRSVTWEGRRTFGTGEPAIVVDRTGAAGLPVVPIAGGVAVLALVVVGGYVLFVRDGETDSTGPGPAPTAGDDGAATGGTEEGAEAPAAAGETGDGASTAGSEASTAGASGAAAGTSEGAGADAAAEADAAVEDEGDATGEGEERADEGSEPPEELLSNEERVMQLLRDQGGRIKQQTVVQELDWTAAKTSQVVNDMREAGDIEVFRLGRENVIRLPEEDEGELP